MMQRKSPVTRLVCAALMALTACQDLPTAVVPSNPAPPAAARSAGGLHLGQSPVVCVFGRPAPAPAAGWQTRRETIFIPRSGSDEGGQMVRYVFWQLAAGGGVAHTASCTVPYTEAALRRVDRLFGVERGGGADQFVVREGMLTTQSCVEDENTGACVFNPLVVTAPPKENVDPCETMPLECTYKAPGGADDYWGDASGPWSGGGGDPAPPQDTEPARSYQQGPILWGMCVLAMGGSSYSIWQVSDKFEAWYKAYQDAEGLYRTYQATIENNTDPAVRQLYEYQYKQARQRQEDAKGAVSEATTMSFIALAGAALACGATALIPVP